jgi:PAS domain S-box-containing protein
MRKDRDPSGGHRAARRLTAEGFARVHASPNATAIVSFEDGSFLDANTAFVDISGFERSELLDHDLLDVGVFVDVRHRDAMLRELGDCGEVRAWRSSLRRRDGVVRDILFSAHLLEVAGRPAVLARIRDVTEGAVDAAGRVGHNDDGGNG